MQKWYFIIISQGEIKEKSIYLASTWAALLAVHMLAEDRRLVTFLRRSSKQGSVSIHTLPALLSACKNDVMHIIIWTFFYMKHF